MSDAQIQFFNPCPLRLAKESKVRANVIKESAKKFRSQWLLAYTVSLLSVAAQGADFHIDVLATVTGAAEVHVDIRSNIPGQIDVMLSLGLAGQAPSDVFIGTSKRMTIRDGRATASLGKKGLPEGEYEVKVSFYPAWGPQDAKSKAAGVKDAIRARQLVRLKGTGQSVHAEKTRAEGQRWVMENVYASVPWKKSVWINRFGQPESVPVTRLNPDIIKGYYFPNIDMTIFANELRGEVSHWRIGRSSD